MKRIFSYILVTVLLLSAIGCACGKAEENTLENPEFVVVTDDVAKAEALLAYFQASTGYLPASKLLDEDSIAKAMQTKEGEDPLTREAALWALTDDATVCLFFGDAFVAELEALGFPKGEEVLLPCTVLKQPAGKAVNGDALSALLVWLNGAEAKLLSEQADLWN